MMGFVRGRFAMQITMQPPITTALRGLGLTPEQQAEVNRKSLSAVAIWAVREMARATTSRGQGQPGGSAWKPLSPAWAEHKEIMGWSPLMGVAQGRMRNSLTPNLGIEKDKVKAQIGPLVSYGRWFNKLRPLAPEETYVGNWWTKAHLELMERAGGAI